MTIPVFTAMLKGRPISCEILAKDKDVKFEGKQWCTEKVSHLLIPLSFKTEVIICLLYKHILACKKQTRVAVFFLLFFFLD